METRPADIRALEEQLDAAERDAQALVAGLDEPQGAWRPSPGAWSVAQCLDHLATANRVYLQAMHEPAVRARMRGKCRLRPALPGLIGGWFIRSLEPPVKTWSRRQAPRIIAPGTEPSLAESFGRFAASQNEVRAFVHEFADLDLSGVRFPNPFVTGVRFSLATGLHVIPAHERRHLWQAWRVREAIPRQ